MKLIHQQWSIVGQVLVVDDDGNAIELGKDQNGQPARIVTVNIPVARFRGNEFEAAYSQARIACDELLAKFNDTPALALVPQAESAITESVPDPDLYLGGLDGTA